MLLLPRPATDALPAALPWWDIPARMLVTLVLVGVISLDRRRAGAAALGHRLDLSRDRHGGRRLHASASGAAMRVRHMLRGLTVSLLAFVAFFLVVGLTLPAVGLVISYLLAVAVAVPVSVVLLACAIAGSRALRAVVPASPASISATAGKIRGKRARFGRAFRRTIAARGPPRDCPRQQAKARGSGRWSSCSAPCSGWRAARRSSSS